MDRYHLAWLMVGKPKGIVRGREMTGDEEAAYVREVASQKTAALRMSLDAVERQGMPFRRRAGGVGAGQGMGEVPAVRRRRIKSERRTWPETTRRSIPLDPEHAAPPRRRPAGGRPSTSDHDGTPGHAALATTPARAVKRDVYASPAVGGTRDDPGARRRRARLPPARPPARPAPPGTVDGYFGPAELKAPRRHGAAPPAGAPSPGALALRSRGSGPRSRSPIARRTGSTSS